MQVGRKAGPDVHKLADTLDPRCLVEIARANGLPVYENKARLVSSLDSQSSQEGGVDPPA
jgi:hypothetical protein